MIPLLISLALANQVEQRQLEKAMVYTVTEFWKISELNKQTKKFAKRTYKSYTDRETRKFIGVVFPLTQMLINREIRYRWEF